jgi:hypothetical protein
VRHGLLFDSWCRPGTGLRTGRPFVCSFFGYLFDAEHPLPPRRGLSRGQRRFGSYAGLGRRRGNRHLIVRGSWVAVVGGLAAAASESHQGEEQARQSGAHENLFFLSRKAWATTS